MYKTTDFRGTFREGMRFSSMSGDALYRSLKNDFPYALKEKGIPCIVSQDEAKSGGFFGTKLPMLVVRHPNPPTRFFDLGFVVNGNVISFVYLGESEQNTKMNKKNALTAEGKYIQAGFVKPDEFILQQEKMWNADVLAVFESLCSEE